MRRILILFPFILMHSLLYAQRHSIGLHAGVTNNGSSSNLEGRLYETRDRHWGKFLNVAYRYGINNKLELESGISFLERNYGSHRTGVYQGIYSKTSNSFINIPFKAVFRILDIDKFSVKTSGGVYGGYWIAERVSGALPNILNSQTGNNNAQGEQMLGLTYYCGKVAINSQTDNRFQLGGTGGVEMGLAFNRFIQVNLQCDGYYTLTCYKKRSSLPKKCQRDSGFIISMGALWYLSHGK